MRKLFGTDGIRGVAGEYPLDKKTVYAAGRGLGDHLPAGPRRVVIGQDTRESSGWIADTLAAGLHDSGVETASAGVVPTPAIAHLTHTHSFSAGVVISASHNPWRDNGVKVFGHDGYKLPDEVELEIESEIFSLLNNSAAVPTDSALKPSSSRRFCSAPGLSQLAGALGSWRRSSSYCGGLRQRSSHHGGPGCLPALRRSCRVHALRP